MTELLDTIVSLRDDGISIVLVTHRPPDVLAICDRVMVLKDGVSQGIYEVRDTTLDSLTGLILRGRAAA